MDDWPRIVAHADMDAFYDKPDGLTVVSADRAKAWLAPLPVSRLWGAGKRTVPRLHALGLTTIGDVATADARLLRRLGSLGAHFHDLANARDPRPVHRGRLAKSIGSDRTLVADVSRREDIELHLRRAADRIGRRLRAKRYVARGVRVRLKTRRFEMLTRQRKVPRPIDLGAELMAAGQSLLDQFSHPGPFRLVGLAAFDLAARDGDRQLDLFKDGVARDLETTIDDLIERFGCGVVTRARDLADWGSVASDGVNLDFLEDRLEETSPPRPRPREVAPILAELLKRNIAILLVAQVIAVTATISLVMLGGIVGRRDGAGARARRPAAVAIRGRHCGGHGARRLADVEDWSCPRFRLRRGDGLGGHRLRRTFLAIALCYLLAGVLLLMLRDVRSQTPTPAAGAAGEVRPLREMAGRWVFVVPVLRVRSGHPRYTGYSLSPCRASLSTWH